MYIYLAKYHRLRSWYELGKYIWRFFFPFITLTAVVVFALLQFFLRFCLLLLSSKLIRRKINLRASATPKAILIHALVVVIHALVVHGKLSTTLRDREDVESRYRIVRIVTPNYRTEWVARAWPYG